MTPARFILLFSTFLALFFALIPHVLWLVGWLISLMFGHHLRYAPFGWTALALVVLVALTMTYGFFIGRWRLQIKQVAYSHMDVPAAFDGFRIVHISDLHLSTFDDNPAQLQRFVDEINAQKPDLVCFTGDLVTMGYKEAEPYAGILRQINAPHGVVSVLGNHDFLIYGNNFKDNSARLISVNELADFERDTLGWQLLRNDSVIIRRASSQAAKEAAITIVGVDNKNCSGQGFQTIDCGDLAKALGGTESAVGTTGTQAAKGASAMESAADTKLKDAVAATDAEYADAAKAAEGAGAFRILLSHDPSHWEAEVIPTTDIQLTLSGHTHAAQIGLFGWNAASLMFRQSYGRYDIDGQTIYVNPGLGCTAPFRLGARPEITVITLHPAETTPHPAETAPHSAEITPHSGE